MKTCSASGVRKKKGCWLPPVTYKTLALLLFLVTFFSCSLLAQQLKTGAESMEKYLPHLKNRKVGLVVNQTSMVANRHLVDTLLALNVNITAIYAPEHGYKGNVERGLDIASSKDDNTDIPIFSIYGKNKKPLPEQLKNVDVLIFDIQDVGVRFFTYISTLHYVMEACAENNKELIVLDRPNPLGYYVDGPVLEPKFRSFIGMHTIPIVHGMTVAEFAQMLNGEGWLKKGVKCSLKVITMDDYDLSLKYHTPIPPSPNLPDMRSVYLYPSICLFEGADVNEGRGTDKPFQLFGAPYFMPKNFKFTPRPIPGFALHPKFEGQACYGYDLSEVPYEELENINRINLSYLMEFYKKSKNKDKFFEDSFNLLAGNDKLKKQIIEGVAEEDIRKSWEPGLAKFKEIRKKYLLYE